MRSKSEKVSKILVSMLLLIAILVAMLSQMMLYTSGNERFFSGDAADYYQSLLDAGFPQDYASALTEIHLLHPTWTFEPLQITEINSQYTWNYVISQETAEEDTNLILKSNTYSAYWHETNRNEPEAGSYQPSRAAVAYFMDPRNFLNEADLFQFFDLSDGTTASQAAVEAVLAGTFMEDALLENGMTYAAYFCEAGRSLSVNPVYLAVKVRQEQGAGGTSPLISGECGSKLNSFYLNQTKYTDSGKAVIPPTLGTVSSDTLLAYDGYFNYFNISASGEGVFDIYLNAMVRAKTGTDGMSTQWGGSNAWNTRWKSIYGGASILKNSYIDRYQPTIYLQKFNVDSRSGRTFWGQYMQSVFGALSEGRILYQSFAAIGALDAPCSFLIPVYADMPTELCADPANGSCSVTAQATAKYTVQNELVSPIRQSAKNATLYLEQESYSASKIDLNGVFTHTYGVEALEYRWDSSDWSVLSDGTVLDTAVSVQFAENTSHILTIRGKAAFDNNDSARKCNTYFLCAVIYVTVLPPPSVTLTYEVANMKSSQTVRVGSTLTLPKSDAPDFAGWIGSDGSFLPSGAEIKIEDDVTYSAVFLEFQTLQGAALSLSESPHIRFSAIMRESSYRTLCDFSDNAIRIYAVLETEATEGEPIPLLLQKEPQKKWVCFDVDTPSLLPTDYNTAYSASFYAELTYTNDTQTLLYAQGTPFSRTAYEVASAALADTNAAFSSSERAILEAVLDEN